MSILTDGSCGIVLSSEGESVLMDMLAYAVKKASNTASTTGKGKGKVNCSIFSITCRLYNAQ